jgi:hypothetical protein
MAPPAPVPAAGLSNSQMPAPVVPMDMPPEALIVNVWELGPFMAILDGLITMLLAPDVSDAVKVPGLICAYSGEVVSVTLNQFVVSMFMVFVPLVIRMDPPLICGEVNDTVAVHVPPVI